MPLEETKNEWRARVRNPDEFKWLKQIFPTKETAGDDYPYNKKGIRAIGGALKSTGKVEVQAFRFSKKEKYGWTATEIRKWIKDHGYSLKVIKQIDNVDILIDEVKYEPIDEWINQKWIRFRYITPEFKADKDNKRLKGPVSSGNVDRMGEIVDVKALMASWEKDYSKNPVLRYMHQAGAIGLMESVTVHSEWEGKEYKDGVPIGIAYIDDAEEDVWHKIDKGLVKAFSIGFRALATEQFCPEEDLCYLKYTEIEWLETSVVDVPANADCFFVVVDGEDEKQLQEGGIVKELPLIEGCPLRLTIKEDGSVNIITKDIYKSQDNKSKVEVEEMGKDKDKITEKDDTMDDMIVEPPKVDESPEEDANPTGEGEKDLEPEHEKDDVIEGEGDLDENAFDVENQLNLITAMLVDIEKKVDSIEEKISPPDFDELIDFDKDEVVEDEPEDEGEKDADADKAKADLETEIAKKVSEEVQKFKDAYIKAHPPKRATIIPKAKEHILKDDDAKPKKRIGTLSPADEKFKSYLEQFAHPSNKVITTPDKKKKEVK